MFESGGLEPDDRRSSWKQRWIDRAFLFSAALVAAFVFSLWLFRDQGFNDFGPANVEKMVYGGAQRPYSSRIFVPGVVHLALLPVPADLERRLDEVLARHPAVDGLSFVFDVSADFSTELLIVLFVEYVAILGFLIVLRRMTGVFLGYGPALQVIASLMCGLLLPLFFKHGAHLVYDLPALLFFAAGLLLLAERRWLPFYTVFVLGLLNKETMALMAVVFAATAWGDLTREKFLRHLSAQLSLTVLTRALAVWASEPAGPLRATSYLRDYLLDNLGRIWSSPVWYDYQSVAAIVFFGLLVIWDWPSKPRFLRRSMIVAIPLSIGYLRGGAWGEIRVFYEVFPIVFLLGFHSLSRAAGARGVTGAAEDAD